MTLPSSEVRDQFALWVVDQLGGRRVVEARPMFGALGLYQGGVMFAILHRGRLYLKGTGTTSCRPPFRPHPHQTLHSYRLVPARILEEGEALRREAAAALRATSEKRQDRPSG